MQEEQTDDIGNGAMLSYVDAGLVKMKERIAG